tara:strand:- start:765 stop:1340 length:576 start_codon:yes stop_codon:yes gene_type:complete
MSSENYNICNNYQIYSPGEIWTIYFSDKSLGDTTITFENYYTIYKDINGEYKIDNGPKITNTFGKEIPFPNTIPPSGNSPCGIDTKKGHCYLIKDLIPQWKDRDIYTSTDTKISMNNQSDNVLGNNCKTNNFTINYAPSGVQPIPSPIHPINPVYPKRNYFIYIYLFIVLFLISKLFFNRNNIKKKKNKKK